MQCKLPTQLELVASLASLAHGSFDVNCFSGLHEPSPSNVSMPNKLHVHLHFSGV